MSKRLLVPLDGSPLAERVLPYAAVLARMLEGRVVLLHVHCPVTVVLDPPDLRAVAGRLLAEDVAVMTCVRDLPRRGQIGRVILAAADDLDVGLVVLATHGRGGLSRWLYGSVAEEVLRRTTRPVLLVPPTCDRPWPADRPPRVLVTLDGSEHGEAILAPILDLLGPVGAEVTLLRVAESIDFGKPHSDRCAICVEARARGEEPDIEPVIARRYVDGVAARLRRETGLAVKPRMEIGLAGSRISRYARELDVDLIAMATHGRGGLTRHAVGSVAAETIRHAWVPVLLVRPSDVLNAGEHPDDRDKSSGEPTAVSAGHAAPARDLPTTVGEASGLRHARE